MHGILFYEGHFHWKILKSVEEQGNRGNGPLVIPGLNGVREWGIARPFSFYKGHLHWKIFKSMGNF